MKKFLYISTILACAITLNACSNNYDSNDKADKKKEKTISQADSANHKSYGAYLAGRVAHLRKDFNKASDYYIESLNSTNANTDLVSNLYMLLASKGRIDEASIYADQAIKNGDKNNFTHIIISINQMKNNKFQETIETTKNLKGPIYEEFITPLITSWAYVGLNNKEQAIKTINKLKKEESFKALYHFHAGMIYDYFDDTKNAKKHYEVIEKEESLEMSFRALQVISNFYIRNGQKKQALQLVKRYQDEQALADMLNKLNINLANATKKNTKKIITSPNIGLSEAMFSISATLRQGPPSVDLAHMFISMSIYSNPHYDLAKLLLADILESREMYQDANDIYDTINEKSESYETAQLKKANNFVELNDYASAELLLKSYSLDDSNNFQLYLDLADILRIRNKHKEALEYYKLALSKINNVKNKHWAIYYAMGISYEQTDNWEKAETNFKKALKLSNKHYYVLNYLGYSWLKQGINTEQAFSMIVDAYNQAPQDGNITDSLGWALYKLGYYNNAIIYLEKAAEIMPANAIISNHLGDAYWHGNRKNEAKFQWSHALIIKDESGELDRKNVKSKVISGLKTPKEMKFDKKLIEGKITEITKD